MAGLAFILGGPKSDKGSDKPPEKPDGADKGGGGMDSARKDAVRAVAKALGKPDADVDSLDSALQAFVEACEGDDEGGGYSGKE